VIVTAFVTAIILQPEIQQSRVFQPKAQTQEINMSEVFVNARATLISVAIVAASVAVPVLTMLGVA
jgi:hypothetical protein